MNTQIVVKVKIENLEDVYLADVLLTPARIRFLEIEDAVIDTEFECLGVPSWMIMELGLERSRSWRKEGEAGAVSTRFYRTVRLTLQDRDLITDVVELPDTCPVLIGQMPIEAMDFVVDLPNHRLTGNPDHGGEQMIDLL